MNNNKKSIYSIYPRIYCSGSVYVNDVPVVDWYGVETKDGGSGGDTMINQAILQSGRYKVVGKMLPRHGKNILDHEDMMSINFYNADFNNWKESRFEFAPKIESPWDGLSENIKYPSFQIIGEIEVVVPYEIEGWQNSLDLIDIDKKKLFGEAYSFYQKIHYILKQHDIKQFLQMSSEKILLQEQVFYFDEMRKKSFANGVNELFSQKLEVEDLNIADLKIEIIGYGKLMRLLKLDGSNPLQYISKDLKTQSNIEIEIKIHKKSESDEFSII